MKFKDKADFINTSRTEWSRFTALLDELTEAQLQTDGVWGEHWNIKDLMAHIHEWHNMVLLWHSKGIKGFVEMPAPGYRWSETPALNREIYEKYRSIGLKEARREMEQTHEQLLQLAAELTETQLLKPAQFPWCGKNAITTYLAAAIISHYRWGQKKIKDWKKRTDLASPASVEKKTKVQRKKTGAGGTTRKIASGKVARTAKKKSSTSKKKLPAKKAKK